MNDEPVEPPPFIKWTDDLSVGIAAIDEDHKAFIELANLLNNMNFESNERSMVIESSLLMLEEYVAGHFLREEKAMKKINYKYFAEHRHKHEKFRGKIKALLNAYREGTTSIVNELPNFVTKWLIDHISKEDTKFKFYLTDGVVDSRPLAFLALEAEEEEEYAEVQKEYTSNVKARIDYKIVKALICEPSAIIRKAARFALNELGVGDIEEASSFFDTNRLCTEYDYQIIIINHDIESNDATYLIKQIREQKLGRDPFVLSVLLLTSRDETIVRKAMHAGSDTMLLIPFSTGQLIDQLKAQVENRKPFIVTQDYIGPERRTEYRPGCSSAAQIPVPNPVQARGLSITQEQYESTKTQAIQAIAQARIKSLAGAIEYECSAIMVSIRDNTATRQTSFVSLSKLDTLSEELSDKIVKFMATPTTNILAFRKRCGELKDCIDRLNFNDAESLYADGKNVAASLLSR